MGDLISRSALMEVIEELFPLSCKLNGQEANVCRHAVQDAPAVDAVPVVRCKDCKHFKYYKRTGLCVDGKTVHAGWCIRRTRYDEDIRMLPDNFCSYGERKDNG